MKMLQFFASVGNVTGFQSHARGLLGALDTIEVPFNLTIIGGGVQGNLEEREAKVIQKGINNLSQFSKDNPSIFLFHEFMCNQFCGSPMIGYPVFEVDKFDPKSLIFLRNLDHIFVTSKWAQGVLEKNGIKVPSTVIHEGVDPNIFYPEPMMVPHEFTFVTVGKWEVRKSSAEMIAAFTQEFEKEEEKLTFFCHVYNPFLGGKLIPSLEGALSNLGYNDRSAEEGLLVAKKNNLTIKVPLQPVPQSKIVAKMYKEAHCGVFASKAEGWDLGATECLACGTPIIATNCTAHTEYLEGYEPELLINQLTPTPANDGIWFDGTRGDWYDFPMSELQSRMRWAYDHRDDLRKIGNEFGGKIRSEYTWNDAARQVKTFLETL